MDLPGVAHFLGRFRQVDQHGSPQAPAQNAPAEQTPQLGLKQVTLIIRSANGPHRFRVQVAATADEQEKGLMFRRSLPGDEGFAVPSFPPASTTLSSITA